MTCSVCSGAFSWRENLLYHFGAMHHLEELVAHLESEFTCETYPPCCRVPRTLFRNLLPQLASGMPTSASGSDIVQHMQENDVDIMEDSDSDLPVCTWSDGERANGDVGTECADSDSAAWRESSDVSSIKSIERYHCDLCEFSANDFHQFVLHGSQHESETMPLPPALNSPSSTVGEETSQEHTFVSPRKQAEDKYVCGHCPFSSRYPCTLAKHMDAHKRSALVSDGYKCAYCNMASSKHSSIRVHQTACHHDQPLKAVPIRNGKVVKFSGNTESASKTVKSKSLPLSSAGIAKRKRKRKLKPPKSKLTATKNTSSASQKTTTSKRARSASYSNTEVLNGDKGSVEALESKLPKQMIYANSVNCPLCDFNSRARVNLVRHIRLIHGNHQQSHTRPLKSCPLIVNTTNCANVDMAQPMFLPLQVQILKFNNT